MKQTLINVRPSLAIHYLGDGLAPNAVPLSYMFVPHSARSELAYVTHGLLGKFSLAELFSSCELVKLFTDCVATVFRTSNPLKIFNFVIQFIAINVVNLWLVLGVRNERLGDKSMDRPPVSGALFAHWHCKVAGWLKTAFYHLSRHKLIGSPTATNDAAERLYTAKIGDLVNTLKAVNVPPFFSVLRAFHLVPDTISGHEFQQPKAVSV